MMLNGDGDDLWHLLRAGMTCVIKPCFFSNLFTYAQIFVLARTNELAASHSDPCSHFLYPSATHASLGDQPC